MSCKIKVTFTRKINWQLMLRKESVYKSLKIFIILNVYINFRSVSICNFCFLFKFAASCCTLYHVREKCNSCTAVAAVAAPLYDVVKWLQPQRVRYLNDCRKRCPLTTLTRDSVIRSSYRSANPRAHHFEFQSDYNGRMSEHRYFCGFEADE